MVSIHSSNFGATIVSPDGGNAHGWAFGEDQGRYVIATDDARAVTTAAKNAEQVPSRPVVARLRRVQLVE